MTQARWTWRRSNHTLVYEWLNRGNKLITSFRNVGITPGRQPLATVLAEAGLSISVERMAG